jgi:ATP-dependent helicase HrpB
MAEGRTGTLVRESLVESPLFVAAQVREVDGRNGRMTLLGLATAVRLEWLQELYPQHLSERSVCVVDRLHKRVGAIRETRFLDLVVARESAGLPDPSESGQALANAFASGWFDLPQLNHSLKQFIVRVNLLARIAPELEVPPFDGAALNRALSTAFQGLTLVKEAQAADLEPGFSAHLDSGQRSFLDELLPLTWTAPGGQRLKLVYPETDQDEEEEELRGPEVQIRLSDGLGLKEHPRLAEGRLPITLVLLTPDQKRLGATQDFPAWRSKSYPALRAQLRSKYGSVAWP